jgi:amino acid transporter
MFPAGAEVKDAPRRVPQSMVASVVINGTLAFAFIICVLFCIGDVTNALSTPTGYPIIEILYQATGSKGATTALMSLIVFLGLVAMFSTLASVSRLTWAFARDNGLPFSTFFGKVRLLHDDSSIESSPALNGADFRYSIGSPRPANSSQFSHLSHTHRHAP